MSDLFILNPYASTFCIKDGINHSIRKLMYLQNSISANCFDEQGKLIVPEDDILEGLWMIAEELEAIMQLSNALYKKI